MSGIRGGSFFSEAFRKQCRRSHVFSIRTSEFLNKEGVDKIAKRTIQASCKRKMIEVQKSHEKNKRTSVGKLLFKPQKMHPLIRKIFRDE